MNNKDLCEKSGAEKIQINKFLVYAIYSGGCMNGCLAHGWLVGGEDTEEMNWY